MESTATMTLEQWEESGAKTSSTLYGFSDQETLEEKQVLARLRIFPR
jgi:hypothetical protein